MCDEIGIEKIIERQFFTDILMSNSCANMITTLKRMFSGGGIDESAPDYCPDWQAVKSNQKHIKFTDQTAQNEKRQKR